MLDNKNLTQKLLPLPLLSEPAKTAAVPGALSVPLIKDNEKLGESRGSSSIVQCATIPGMCAVQLLECMMAEPFHLSLSRRRNGG